MNPARCLETIVNCIMSQCKPLRYVLPLMSQMKRIYPEDNNAGGAYSDTIGMMLALYQKKHEEAESFLAEALLLNTIGLVNSVVGYALVLSSRRDYTAAKRMSCFDRYPRRKRLLQPY